MMKFSMIVILTCVVALTGSVAFAEEAPQEVVDLANSTLAPIGMDAVIVDAVKEQNSHQMTLDSIKKQDTEWREHTGYAPYMQKLIDNTCGKHLQTILNSQEYYAEIFVMDNQGANVCMTDKTSDYWQGDEAKFNKSFNGGTGAVFIDEVEFDDSTQAYLVQVSVPVMDGGAAIGAITFGIDVDKVQ